MKLHPPPARTTQGEDRSNPPAKYEGTERIEPPSLSTVPRSAGILITDSGIKPRVAAPPSPPMPTSGRSPRRPLPPSYLRLFAIPARTLSNGRVNFFVDRIRKQSLSGGRITQRQSRCGNFPAV